MSENKNVIQNEPVKTTHPTGHPAEHPTDIPPVVLVTCMYDGKAYSEGAVVNGRECASNGFGEGVWIKAQ